MGYFGHIIRHRIPSLLEGKIEGHWSYSCIIDTHYMHICLQWLTRFGKFMHNANGSYSST